APPNPGGRPPPAAPRPAPAQTGHGDLASPLAMGLAKGLRRPPREIGEAVAEALRDSAEASRWLAAGEGAPRLPGGVEPLAAGGRGRRPGLREHDALAGVVRGGDGGGGAGGGSSWRG